MADFLLPINEQEILSNGNYSRIIGIDEVGRGCWAGPVAVGAYIYTIDMPLIKGIHDSKMVPPHKREELYSFYNSHDYKVVMAEPEEIDSRGITKTIEYLISNLVEELQDSTTLFLIDGRFTQKFGPHAKTVIKGDSKFYSIAAASIAAKVLRDRKMQEYEEQYAGYGFAQHNGYGTKLHREALAKLGVSDIHRKSYKPIYNLLSTMELN